MASSLLIGQAVNTKYLLFRNFTFNVKQHTNRCFNTSRPLLRQPHIVGEERLRRLDRISEQYKLVYKGGMNYIAHCGKFVAAALGVGMVGTWIYDYFYDGMAQSVQLNEGMKMLLEAGEWKWLSGLAIANCFFLFCGCQMYVLRIYRNGNKYIAILPGLIPKTNTKVPFIEGGLTSTNLKLPFHLPIHRIATRRVFLFPNYFRLPSDYHEAINSSRYVLRRR